METIKNISTSDKIKTVAYTAKLKLASAILKVRNKAPKILTIPDERLKMISTDVNFDETDYQERADIVKKLGFAIAKVGYGDKLGMAAPQIGISKRVIIVAGNVIFNPTWQPADKTQTVELTEACYSCPGKFYKVTRSKYGWAKWTNIHGVPMGAKIKGMNAIIFQHELNHLDGLCCCDVGIETSAPK